MGIELPHFPAEFKLTEHGAVYVEQDSPEDIAACVFRIVSTVTGFREDYPEFGVGEVVFQNVPLNLGALEAAIEKFEPRAELNTTEGAQAMQQALRQIGIEVS